MNCMIILNESREASDGKMNCTVVRYFPGSVPRGRARSLRVSGRSQRNFFSRPGPPRRESADHTKFYSKKWAAQVSFRDFQNNLYTKLISFSLIFNGFPNIAFCWRISFVLKIFEWHLSCSLFRVKFCMIIKIRRGAPGLRLVTKTNKHGHCTTHHIESG